MNETKKAKGSTPRMPGSYHLGKTGSADADVKTKEGYSGTGKITNKKAISESKEVNDIVALATRVVGNKAVAKQTGAMMNLKKLAGI